MLSGPRTLASRLLFLMFGACTLSACLLPQEDRVLNFPPLRNRPPRIMEELGVLPDPRVIAIGTGCPRLDFRFRAEDPDVDDTLFVRWYVDYTVLPFFIPDQEQRLAPSGRPIRNEQGSYSVDLASPSLRAPENLLQVPGTHVVEAILFDGTLFGLQRRPQPRSPAVDGGVENPSYAVSYAWVVQTPTRCPP